MKNLKLIFLMPGFVFLIANQVNAQHAVKKLWETDSILNIPESVLPETGMLYTSLIDGEGWGVDGKGEIAKLTRDGRVIDLNWITGLNAPKGLARNGDHLYVADIDELVVISIGGNKIAHKIKVAGATGLNDVTVDDKGVVYVTDSKKNAVFRIEGDNASLYLEGLKGANGIKAIGDKLYILTGDGFYISDASKKISKLCVLESGGDGIEPIGNGDFLVTAWVGYLYYVYADGHKDVLLDTHTTPRKTADIGYDPKTKIVYVPTFLGKSITAYQLE